MREDVLKHTHYMACTSSDEVLQLLFLPVLSQLLPRPAPFALQVLRAMREDVLKHTHYMACTSSDEVLAASELGKGKGQSVYMIVYLWPSWVG